MSIDLQIERLAFRLSSIYLLHTMSSTFSSLISTHVPVLHVGYFSAALSVPEGFHVWITSTGPVGRRWQLWYIVEAYKANIFHTNTF